MIKMNSRVGWLLGLMLLVGCQQTPTHTGTGSPPVEPVPEVVTEPQLPQGCQCPPPRPEPVAAKPCTAVKPPKPLTTSDDLLVIGRIEYVYVTADNIRLKARIDTGAGLSSMHADGLTDFERDGKPWVRFSIPFSKGQSLLVERPVKRFISIKQHTGKPQRRPVVAMPIELGAIKEQVDVTLTNREDYLYQVLIGRNFLRDRAIVDVRKKFTIKKPE